MKGRITEKIKFRETWLSGRAFAWYFKMNKHPYPTTFLNVFFKLRVKITHPTWVCVDRVQHALEFASIECTAIGFYRETVTGCSH